MNDMRLIDADELLTDPYFTDETIPERVMFIEAVEDSITIDAVPVVRCKDCKHYHDFETHYDCNHTCGMDYVRPTDFCSYGERKDGDA